MPNNNQQNKQKKKQFESEVKQLFGGDLTQEIRQLIDLAVRKQFNTQDFVERLTNTHYFRRQFPGLLEKNGTIANGLTGEQGVGVSAASLTGAIKNYRTALNQNQQIAQQYGYNFNKDQLAKLIQDQTSPDEFKARLGAVELVNSNPALKDAYEAQLRASGQKVTPHSAYQAALKLGDKGFMNLYEGAQYQNQLGLNRNDAHALATGKGSPVGATFESIDQVVQAARQNLQTIGPELAAQGITTPQLVKILNNPSAYSKEMGTIQQTLESRKSLFGRPVPGTYPQQGQSGGLSQYPQQREQAYG